MSRYRSFGAQSLHYFDRADEARPTAPLEVRAAWRGADMRTSDDWRFALSAAHVAELDRALEVAKASGRPTGVLSREDFPLPTLSAAIDAWREELARGRGFVLITGVPVERLGEEGASLLFWGLGLHLGTPGAQNPQGDLLGHVVDTGDDRNDPLVRLYRTSSDIAYHCDAADVVGLLCLRKARQGGLSRIASSVTVFNEIVRRRPDLAPRLFEPFALDLRNEQPAGMQGWVPIPPCRYASGALRTFYHSDYFRSSERHDDVRLSRDERALLDLYEEIASSPEVRLDMDLAPGDIQLVSNHTIVHARTGYEDGPAPSDRRHLLRLWLSL